MNEDRRQLFCSQRQLSLSLSLSLSHFCASMIGFILFAAISIGHAGERVSIYVSFFFAPRLPSTAFVMFLDLAVVGVVVFSEAKLALEYQMVLC